MDLLRRKDNYISPVLLIHKLGRYVAISTATGDFYSLSRDAYDALKAWSHALSCCSRVTPSMADRSAQEYGILPKIAKLFPLPSHSRLAAADKKTPSCVTDLTLNLTAQCNLRCVYCWNDCGAYSSKKFRTGNKALAKATPDNGVMSLDVACRSVDLLIEQSGDDKNLVVDFYGGEPLMNLPVLLGTVDYCRQQQKKYGVSFHYLLATNGTLLTPRVARQLIDRGVQIAVSIDGPKDIHDHNRPFSSAKGSYGVITRNLRSLPKGMMKRLVGRTTVTPFFPDMVSLYKSLHDLGFERVEIFESEDACHKITSSREDGFFVTEKQFKVLCDEYERLALHYIEEILKGQLDYKKTFFNRFFKLMQRLYYHHEVTGGCPAAKGQFAVMADGGIYPCTAFLGIKEFEFGNINQGLDHQRYGRFIKAINKRFDHCRGCALFSLCRSTGSCLNMNYYFNGDPAVSYDKSCDLFFEKVGLAVACLDILSEKIPDRLEGLFGFDPVGRRGNNLY